MMQTDHLGPRELSDATGVSTDTLRHYERLKLLSGVRRSHAGYRRYPSAAVERVLLIQRALVVGFSLADLQRVLMERDRGGAPCRGVRALVAERLEELNNRIDELAALKRDLQALIADWDLRLAGTPPGKRAHLLETLQDRPAVERARLNRRGRA
jgi:DNA-binding transcriptional MerR regulator